MIDERLIRRLLPYSSVAVIVALAYVGWIFVSRSMAHRASERAAEAERAKADQKIVQAYGDGHVKVLSFYASPATLKRGEKGLLCYGVANAKTVRIEPKMEPVHPSLSRCLEIRPEAETRYTLTAQDGNGNTETRTLVLKVK